MKQLTAVHRPATFSPQALGAGTMTRTILDDAGHNPVRVIRTGPIPRTSSIRDAAPISAAHFVVEANAVVSPVV